MILSVLLLLLVRITLSEARDRSLQQPCPLVLVVGLLFRKTEVDDTIKMTSKECVLEGITNSSTNQKKSHFFAPAPT